MPDRIRWLCLGSGSLVFALLSAWLLLHPERGGTFAAVAGLFFFGAGAVAGLHAASKDKAWPQRIRGRSRLQYLVLPAVLAVVLPGPLKWLFALPLLLAWAILFPRYADRRALLAACVFSAALALGQAVLFVVAIASAMAATQGVQGLFIQAAFALLVGWLDLQVGLEARRRWRQGPLGISS